jgi:SapC
LTKTQITAVTRERHAGKKWQRPSGYGFAATNALVPVVGAELGLAALVLPLAFLQEADRFVLVAVLSLTPGRNTLVAPDGRWLGRYVPACFRGYPFRLFPTKETGRLALCVEADGGAVEAETAGEDFFDREGNLSPILKKIFDFLNEYERNRQATNVAVSALAEAGVISPWPIRIKAEKNEREIAGLHRIDETALNALPDDAFLKLRKSLALPIAYAQMFSAALIRGLEQLTRNEQRPKPATDLPESLDSLFGLSTDDVIKFNS